MYFLVTYLNSDEVDSKTQKCSSEHLLHFSIHRKDENLSQLITEAFRKVETVTLQCK